MSIQDCERNDESHRRSERANRSVFFKGKAMGQQYAWLEANLVFEVAILLARMDVPALTVHDEFVVPVDMVEAVHEVRYTTAFTDLW